MNEDQNVYELGFHIAPSLAEGEVEAVVASIKAAITDEKGNVFAEESPKLTNLAYKIVLRSDAGTSQFDKAYFGWLKFTSDPSAVANIQAFAKAQASLIRFILVKTDRTNTVQFHKSIVVKKEEVLPDGEVVQVKKEEVEVDMDKEIDNLVV